MKKKKKHLDSIPLEIGYDKDCTSHNQTSTKVTCLAQAKLEKHCF